MARLKLGGAEPTTHAALRLSFAGTFCGQNGQLRVPAEHCNEANDEKDVAWIDDRPPRDPRASDFFLLGRGALANRVRAASDASRGIPGASTN